MLDRRIVGNLDEIPSHAIILAYENKTVHELNKKRINAGEGTVVKNISVHVAIGVDSETREAKKRVKAYSKIDNLEKTDQLPRVLLLKEGRKYMVTKNIDTSDGLCNGTVGTLMKIVNQSELSIDEPRPTVLRLWFDFTDQDIGAKQRAKEQSLYNKDGIEATNSHWTPICYTASTIFSSKNRYRIQRYELEKFFSISIYIYT